MQWLAHVSVTAVHEELVHFMALAQRVMGQNERRVFNEESVPAREKLVSIFEEHTDIIVKDQRETLYGHKICLTSGRSTLVTDCTILEGNPADSTLAQQAIDRHIEILGGPPKQVVYDGGFSFRAKFAAIKNQRGADVAVSKAPSLPATAMVPSSSGFQKLRGLPPRHRSTTSFLQKTFRLDR